MVTIPLWFLLDILNVFYDCTRSDKLNTFIKPSIVNIHTARWWDTQLLLQSARWSLGWGYQIWLFDRHIITFLITMLVIFIVCGCELCSLLLIWWRENLCHLKLIHRTTVGETLSVAYQLLLVTCRWRWANFRNKHRLTLKTRQNLWLVRVRAPTFGQNLRIKSTHHPQC